MPNRDLPAMSIDDTFEPPSRSLNPKRKRSLATSDRDDHGAAGYEDDTGAAGAQLQYAYDDELASDAEQAFHTPEEDADRLLPVRKKRRRVERPRTLDYVPCMTLRGHKRGVTSVKFSPDGKWIASSCECSIPSRDPYWSLQADI